MPSIRPVTKHNEWYLSIHEFYTAYHFAMQYETWVNKAKQLCSLSGMVYDGMPHATFKGSPTERNAMELAEINAKIKMVDDLAEEAGGDIAKWILMAVTSEGSTYNYLRLTKGLPCGKNLFYKCRRKFYYLLSKKLSKLV